MLSSASLVRLVKVCVILCVIEVVFLIPGVALTALPATVISPYTPLAPVPDLYVGGGCPSPSYKTIQEAINAANPGNIIAIAGNQTFNENLTITKNLTLTGGFNKCTSASSLRSTINGGSIGRVVYVGAGIEVNLQNLNITHGQFTTGGGLYVASGSTARGENLHIYENTGTTTGGGVRLYGATAWFTNTAIYSNTSSVGAGLAAIKTTTDSVYLSMAGNSNIYSNTATTGDGFGGGVYISDGSAHYSGCTKVQDNDALMGGGTYAVTSTVTMLGDCTGIMGNHAVEDGGGIYAQGSSITLGDDALLSDNQAGVYDTSLGYGGGAFLDDSNFYGHHIAILDNTATGNGGGVYAKNDSLFVMDLGIYPCAGPRCSQLSGNSVNNDGGGVYAYESVVDLEQTYMEGNGGYCGLMVAQEDSLVYLENTLISNNSSSGGVLCLLDSYLYGSEVTLVQGTTGGDTGIHASGSTSITLARSILWGYATSIDETGHFISCSDIQGGYAGSNINADPKFIDPANSNFHLQGDSPAIDQCLGGLSTDVDNKPRPVTYFDASTPYDMGAYEGGPRVGINGGECAYATIQAAFDASSPGDTLQAVADTFLENIDIDQDVALKGGYNNACTAQTGDATTIDGRLDPSSSVNIIGGTVLLQQLQITGGSTTGAGISVWGSQVTLDNTDVHHNNGTHGAGLWVAANAVVTATNDSDIYQNTAQVQGGGLYVSGRYISKGSTCAIFSNTAPNGGGIWLTDGGAVWIDHAYVSDNSATGATGKGGGIHADSGSVITLTNAIITNGNQAYDGGGIYADNASIIGQLYPIILGNSASHHGGGLYLTNNSTLETTFMYIGGSSGSSSNSAAIGGGLYVKDSMVNFSGEIQGNLAEDQGAGMYADNSLIEVTDALIGGGGAGESNILSAESSAGAGLYLTNGTQAILSNTHIISNTCLGPNLTMGGGAYLTGQSVMTLTNSSVISNTAPSTTEGMGGGLFADYSTIVLQNSQILSNTAGTDGGGIVLRDMSALSGTLSTTFQGNETLNGDGGAINAEWYPAIWLEDVAFRENKAFTYGGAVHIDSGELTLTGWMQIEDNQGHMGGGAIEASGTADVDLYVTSGAQPSYIRNNRSGLMRGGAMYLTNDDTVRIHAVSGYPLQFTTNTAYADGGAIYAVSGPSIWIEGDVWAAGNRSTDLGKGGFIYISGMAKTLEIRATATVEPRIQLSSAMEGGAVYAGGGAHVICEGAAFGDYLNGNYATDYSGGAIYLSDSQLTSTNCHFVENYAAMHGGAIAAVDAVVVIGSDFTECNPVSEACTMFEGNVADGDEDDFGYGGALYADGSQVQLTDTVLDGNQAAKGGAYYHTGMAADAIIGNVLVIDNVVTLGAGAGLYAADQSAITVTHGTFAGNTGGSAISNDANVAAWLYNSIAWGNTLGFNISRIDAACNIDQAGVCGTNVDPAFAGSGDYHLQATSPAIDACSWGLDHDLENETRPTGSGYDMGAYEGVMHRFVYIPVVMRNK